MHRFLISGPSLGIDARISPLTPSFVHRFLISSPDLRIDAAQSSWRWRMARLQWPSPQRPSVSDSNLRCCKGEWSRLQRSWRQRFPRLILFFCSGKEECLQQSLKLRRMACLQQSYRQRVSASDSNIERRPDSKKDSRAIPRCPYFIRCHRSTRLKCFDCFLV